jgi:hypothetical protein
VIGARPRDTWDYGQALFFFFFFFFFFVSLCVRGGGGGPTGDREQQVQAKMGRLIPAASFICKVLVPCCCGAGGN